MSQPVTLSRLEEVVADYGSSPAQDGAALAAIRDTGLWKTGYPSWTAYLERRWRLTADQADTLIMMAVTAGTYAPGSGQINYDPPVLAGGTGLIEGLADRSEVVIPLALLNNPGASDDAGPINESLLRSGFTRLLPGLVYSPVSPISVPSYARLDGGRGPKALLGGGPIIRPGAGFAGLALILLPANSGEQMIGNMALDGSLMPAGTCFAITSQGTAQYVQLYRLLVNGGGFSQGVYPSSQAGSNSNGWRAEWVRVTNTQGTAFDLQNSPDGDWRNCQAIAGGTHGWSLLNNFNSLFTNPRADWCGDYGFIFQGAWSTGTGSGGCVFNGMSTDRNANHGVFVTATGNCPIVINGLQTRRDGSASVSAGWAGLAVSNATLPVLISGWACYPGVNDDGTGNATPEYGLTLNGTNTLVQVSNAMLHAITAGINGTSGASYRNVWTRTGTTAAPTAPALTPDTA